MKRPDTTPTAAKHRLLLVEDHPVVRDGLSQLVSAEPDLEICGEAEDAVAGLAEVERLKPDVVLVDISLEGSNGLEFIKTLRTKFPDVRTVVLSVHDDSLYAERALRAGAMGYVMKRRPGREIIDALRRALRGEFWVSEKVENALFQKALRQQRAGKESLPSHGLTDRELEIFEMLGRGHGTTEIATALQLSVKTVESHRARIKEKLGVRTATELIRHAVRWVERGESSQ